MIAARSSAENAATIGRVFRGLPLLDACRFLQLVGTHGGRGHETPSHIGASVVQIEGLRPADALGRGGAASIMEKIRGKFLEGLTRVDFDRIHRG